MVQRSSCGIYSLCIGYYSFSSLVGAVAGRSSSFLSRAPCLADGSGGSREWCRGLSVGY